MTPFYRLWREERRRRAQAEVSAAELRHSLAVVTAERDATAAHLAEAVKGRERAMSVAKELGGAPRWNEADDVWLADNEIGPA